LSKSNGLIIGLPLVLLLMVMQVYNLWGWLARDGWIQYLMMAEVYLFILVSFLYLRAIYRLSNLWINLLTLGLIPLFYLGFSGQNIASSSIPLWYINIIISIIASAWLIVVVLGTSWTFRELFKLRANLKEVLISLVLLLMSAVFTYFIKISQLGNGVLGQLWELDKLRTGWFVFEPFLVLSFSLFSIYFYFKKVGLSNFKKEYFFIGIFLVSLGFEYIINGFSLVSLRTVIYFLGIYSFINIKDTKLNTNYLYAGIFIGLVALHLSFYSAAEAFFTLSGFTNFLHAALIESIKMLIALYIFILGWMNVKEYKSEFRFIMVFITIIAYTYTTQSKGNGADFYDMVAITAMMKLTALFLIILYSFYFFRRTKIVKHMDLKKLFSRS